MGQIVWRCVRVKAIMGCIIAFTLTQIPVQNPVPLRTETSKVPAPGFFSLTGSTPCSAWPLAFLALPSFANRGSDFVWPRIAFRKPP